MDAFFDFLIEDDDLLEKNNTNSNKVTAYIKNNLIVNLFTTKTLTSKATFCGNVVQIFV